ncbi:MAG: branched-chain amino acid ABC transporter permease [Chloroflexota bacterium]|nr:MAG: branched-chain amino acid ABC transporter permease [Chloroflexota bacterium]
MPRVVDLDSPWWRTVVGTATLAVPLVALALLVSLFMGATEQQVAVNFFISLVAVVGFGIYSGNSGIMSFGHVAFMGIGAYVSALLTMPPSLKATALPNLAPFIAQAQLPFIAGLVGVVVIVALVALAFGIPFARLSVESTSVASFAVLLIVYVVLVASADVTRGSQTFYGVPADASLSVVVIAAIVAILVARVFRESIPGLRLRASREDELASRSMGVNVAWLRLGSWVLSAVVAGLAGALLGANLTAFSPKQFYFTLQFTLLAMLVVGGTSTVSGAVGGTFLVSLLLEAARRVEAALYGVTIGPVHLQAFGLQTLTLGLVILVVMYRLRDGLFGLRELDEVLLSWWHRPRGAPPGVQPAVSNDGGE